MIRVMTQADEKRGAELVLAYMADTDEGRERFRSLMEHTEAEFDFDTMVTTLVALFVGTCNGLQGGTVLAKALEDLLAEPTEDRWLTR